MLLTNERDHIRNAYRIIDDMQELVERFGDITDELENPTQPAPNTK